MAQFGLIWLWRRASQATAPLATAEQGRAPYFGGFVGRFESTAIAGLAPVVANPPVSWDQRSAGWPYFTPRPSDVVPPTPDSILASLPTRESPPRPAFWMPHQADAGPPPPDAVLAALPKHEISQRQASVWTPRQPSEQGTPPPDATLASLPKHETPRTVSSPWWPRPSDSSTQAPTPILPPATQEARAASSQFWQPSTGDRWFTNAAPLATAEQARFWQSVFKASLGSDDQGPLTPPIVFPVIDQEPISGRWQTTWLGREEIENAAPLGAPPAPLPIVAWDGGYPVIGLPWPMQELVAAAALYAPTPPPVVAHDHLRAKHFIRVSIG